MSQGQVSRNPWGQPDPEHKYSKCHTSCWLLGKVIRGTWLEAKSTWKAAGRKGK